MVAGGVCSHRLAEQALLEDDISLCMVQTAEAEIAISEASSGRVSEVPGASSVLSLVLQCVAEVLLLLGLGGSAREEAMLSRIYLRLLGGGSPSASPHLLPPALIETALEHLQSLLVLTELPLHVYLRFDCHPARADLLQEGRAEMSRAETSRADMPPESEPSCGQGATSTAELATRPHRTSPPPSAPSLRRSGRTRSRRPAAAPPLAERRSRRRCRSGGWRGPAVRARVPLTAGRAVSRWVGGPAYSRARELALETLLDLVQAVSALSDAGAGGGISLGGGGGGVGGGAPPLTPPAERSRRALCATASSDEPVAAGEAADVARLGRRGAGLGEGRRCLRLRCCAQAGLVEVHRLVEVLRATKARKRRVQTAAAEFNRKPGKGTGALVRAGILYK